MIDRFDIHLQLPPVAVDALENDARGDPSELVRARVCAARSCMLERRLGSGPRRTRALAKQLAPNARRLLLQSLEMLGLSLRAYSKILRVARTIADLEGSDGIAGAHVAEAIQYRLLDRNPRAPAPPTVRGSLVSM
jgi:magnesium chelatase family protein